MFSTKMCNVNSFVFQVNARLISCRQDCHEAENPVKLDFPQPPNQSSQSCETNSKEAGGDYDYDDTTSGATSFEGTGENASVDGASGEVDYEYENYDEPFRCSTGRKISNYQVCEGQKDCPFAGEDETFEQCHKTLSGYSDEPYTICATTYSSTNLPQFPCFKSGTCIAKDAVRHQ